MKAINRKFPRPLYYLNAASIYLTTLPVHWLLTKLGFKAGLIPLIMKITAGPKGGKKAFESYAPSSQDILVCTYVKSGTNWMMQLAHQVAFHGAGEYENIHDVVAWPDMKGGLMKTITLESTAVQQASPEHKRVIKTHLAASYVPYSESAHYLTVIRDPKEVFVSSYHFARGNYGPLMPSPDAWFELFLTKEFPMDFGSSWAEHTASYWALRDKPNVGLFSFREMKRDLPTAVQQVADLLGVTLTAAEKASVVERSSFAYMQRIDHKFLPMPKENMPWGKHMKMVREGRQGNSKELLTPEQQQRIDRHCIAELKALGSDFPYEKFFQ